MRAVVGAEVIVVCTSYPDFSRHGHDVSAFQSHVTWGAMHCARIAFEHSVDAGLLLRAVFDHARHDKGTINDDAYIPRKNLVETE